jgi:uncharacterized RDD family membrane protein YckC
VKAGYAPCEQYSTKIEQGPWTDIYSLAATFYHLFSRIFPLESTDRLMEDSIRPLAEYNPQIPAWFSNIIMKALSVAKEERYQSVADMRTAITKASVQQNIAGIPAAAPRQPVPVVRMPQKQHTNTGMHSEHKDVSHISRSNQTKQSNLIGRRCAAYLIDTLIYAACIFIFLYAVVTILTERGILFEISFPIISVTLVLSPLIVTIVNALLESSKLKGTFGKHIMRLQVTDRKGRMLLINKSMVRNFVKLLNIFLLFTAKDGVYLHEKLSDSKVLSVQSRRLL